MTGNISLREFLKYFHSEEICMKFFKTQRWPNGVFCPVCNSTDYYIMKGPPTKMSGIDYYKCANYYCHSKFSTISKTMFSNQKIGLHNWFLLIYMMCLNKKSVSSIQNAKNLQVTQKTAWGMMTKVRELLVQDEELLLSGIIEVDEVFVSKGNRWTRWGGISTRKAPILGMVQRGGKVIIKCIEDRSRDTILKEIKKHVAVGSTIYTDGHPSYKSLEKEGYIHDFVEHSTREYVKGDVHSNTIENIWSFFKKSVRNAHHSISEKHCQEYCDEVAWKYNNRELTSMEKFIEVIKKASSI